VLVQHIYAIKKDDAITTFLRAGTVPMPRAGSLLTYLTLKPSVESSGGMRAWCFFYGVDRAVAGMWALLALVFSCGVGLGVDFGTGDGKLGLSVGTGLLAMLAAVHGTVLLMLV
jgi:hypothetical protein